MPSPDEIRAVVRRYAKMMCDSNADGIAALYAEQGHSAWLDNLDQREHNAGGGG